MRMADLIVKKRNGQELSREEIHFIIDGVVHEKIPDYQTSAFLMAVYFQGMNDREITDLTLEMANSGDQFDLSGVDGICVDKHSTGGVGDKTTLIVGPMCAACGVKIAKMSGRGLGFTGGTIDKLESIQGVKTSIPYEQFIRQLNEIGMVISSQTANLAPADKKLYALRDVTGTVESIPLIASSIMSKKLASGADAIVLDVKTGSGALIHNFDDSVKLAEEMVAIGKNAGRKVRAVITDMDNPLGMAIGNALEVKEAVEVLSGRGPADLKEVCMELAVQMLHLSNESLSEEECRRQLSQSLENGSALRLFKRVLKAQGAKEDAIESLQISDTIVEVEARESGYVSSFRTDEIGRACSLLGSGRTNKEDTIDQTVGIVLNKKQGDYVKAGDILARFYVSEKSDVAQAESIFQNAVQISKTIPERKKLIYKIL